MVGRRRTGTSRLGCLFAILVLVAAAYLVKDAGGIFFRYYQFHDAMAQEAGFARTSTDDQIAAHLRAKADSLGLPDPAGAVHVVRTDGGITISTTYTEHLALPGIERDITFTPRVEQAF